MRLIRAEVARSEALLGEQAGRIAGLGLAMPFELWNWAAEIGASEAELAAWRSADIRAELAARAALAGLCAERRHRRLRGRARLRRTTPGCMDFIYFYVGAFIGGGLVLNGGLFAGRTGNAAAIGSMPVPDGAGGSAQLIDVASLVLLERRLRAAGLPLDAIYDPAADWAACGAALDDWLADGGAGHRPCGRRGRARSSTSRRR